ncbi:hypothetical protein Tco_0511939 [Tanacetum coccineum]
MPNILPTLPTLDPDPDFTPSQDSLGSGNKIFDPGIFIEVQSQTILSWDEFSISFIRDPLSPLFATLLPFSSENEDNVFNPGILSYLLVSHRDKIISDFSKNPMMIKHVKAQQPATLAIRFNTHNIQRSRSKDEKKLMIQGWGSLPWALLNILLTKETHQGSSRPPQSPINRLGAVFAYIRFRTALQLSFKPLKLENNDYDSEGDILEELLNNDSLSLPENESFHFDCYYDPSFPRPLEKLPDDDQIYFDAEPDTGILTVKVVDDISKRYDKVFNTGILASKEEKSPHLLSHRGFKAFQLISDFSESPMVIYGGNIPILDVPFLHFYPP